MASQNPNPLKEIAQQIHDGVDRKETVRTLLSWFNAERRGYWKVREIRKALGKVKLKTEPDFEEAWIDAQVTFVPKSKVDKAGASTVAAVTTEQQPAKLSEVEDAATVSRRASEDVTSRIRIGMLTAANRRPLCTSPDAQVSEAITLMLQHDYSQLPVTTTERDVKGIFSWKSLGSRLALGKKCERVGDCMEAAHEIRFDASLFEAIQEIVEHECVLVRDGTRRLIGIVTTADLSLQFAQLGEPFLLLGQIENHVRNLIADKYTKPELVEVRDPVDSGRDIDDVTDLGFGEYIRLLENPKRWEKLGVRIDRRAFTDELKRIGRIRNDVMHFDPDGVGPDDLATLRKFARFLGDLERKLV